MVSVVDGMRTDLGKASCFAYPNDGGASRCISREESSLLSVSASQLPSVDTQSWSYSLQKAGHCARWANPGTNYMVGPRLRVLPTVRRAPGQAQAGD